MAEIKNADIILEALARDGMIASMTSGISMYPMLRHQRDISIILKRERRLQKYDVALYRRGDSLVLHRVIKVLPNGEYIIRGDNCANKEYGITDERIFGYLDSFRRGDKVYKVRTRSHYLYAAVRQGLIPLQNLIRMAKRGVKKLLRPFRKNER